MTRINVENRLLKLAVVVVAVSNILFGFMAWTATKQKTVLLVPVGFSRPIEAGRTVNEAYILEVARFLADSFLNYTPTTVRKQYEAALQFFAPRVYSQYRKIFDKFVDEAETSQLASAFFVDRVEHSPDSRAIKVTGNKVTMLNDQVIERKTISILIKYKTRYGRFYVTECKRAGAAPSKRS